MRLFVAVDISEAVRASVAGGIDMLRAAMQGGSRARVGWVTPERLHLTLEFIGDVPAAVAADVVRRLEPPIALAPFTLRVGGPGLFPSSGRPRVIWFGLDDGVEPMRRLHEEVVVRLDGVPYRPERRSYSPHLTVGRFREPGRVSDRELIAGLDVPDAGSCSVDAVTLYQSRLSPKGSTYTVMLRVPLSVSSTS